MQNPICPTDCPSCQETDVCADGCICPSCLKDPNGVTAWTAFAPVITALSADGIYWTWTNAGGSYSIEITARSNEWIDVYEGFRVERTIARMACNMEEPPQHTTTVIWTGTDVRDCVQAIEFAIGEEL